jgi:hypothetical protein
MEHAHPSIRVAAAQAAVGSVYAHERAVVLLQQVLQEELEVILERLVVLV